MHEFSIAQNILEQVQKHAQGRAKTVRIRVGGLREITADSLRFCLEAISSGTVMQGAELIIEEVAARCVCRECGSEFETERYMLSCPNCRNADVEIISGDELELLELVVE